MTPVTAGSPRLDEAVIDTCRAARSPVGPVDQTETDALVALAHDRHADTLLLGHGQDPDAADAIARLARAWVDSGGTLLDTVCWPERAASWLRQANRFTASTPDLWAVAGPVAGFAQMTRRLAWSTDWLAARTLAFSHLATPTVLGLCGGGLLDGLTGARPDGTRWQVIDGRVRTLPAPPGQQ